MTKKSPKFVVFDYKAQWNWLIEPLFRRTSVWKWCLSSDYFGAVFYPQKVKTGRTLANGSRTGDDWRLAPPVPDPAAVHERLALLSPFEPNHRPRRATTQPTCTCWHYFCPYLRNGLEYIHNSWNIRHSACLLPLMYILMALAFLF